MPLGLPLGLTLGLSRSAAGAADLALREEWDDLDLLLTESRRGGDELLRAAGLGEGERERECEGEGERLREGERERDGLRERDGERERDTEGERERDIERERLEPDALRGEDYSRSWFSKKKKHPRDDEYRLP